VEAAGPAAVAGSEVEEARAGAAAAAAVVVVGSSGRCTTD
jgi:hypothetical protein